MPPHLNVLSTHSLSGENQYSNFDSTLCFMVTGMLYIFSSYVVFLLAHPSVIFYVCLPVDSNDFSRMVAEEYLSFFNFTGLALDQALR